MTIKVPLSQGKFALIDDADFPLVSGFRWYAGVYAAARVKTADGRSTTLYMHRLITGAPKGKEVDHLNRDTLDNRRANLRVGSHKDNMENGKFALATHCPRGHAYDEANTFRIKSKNGRQCRECARLRMQAVLAKETPEQRAHREAVKRANYEKNKERRKAQMKAYQQAHREELRAYYKQWRSQRSGSS